MFLNIVYKFKSRVTGKYYIGSKAECEVVSGKILSRDGRYYFSSSTSDEFWTELSEGQLDLTILQDNVPRDQLLEREAYWQISSGFPNPLCWNKVLATKIRTVISRERLYKVCNIFGQTLNDIAVDNSTVSRKDSAAIAEGFNNYGDKMFFYIKEKSLVGSFAKLDAKYHRKGYFKRYLKGVDLKSFDVAVNKYEIKTLMREGATFIKACEIAGVKDYVARKAFGNDFAEIISKEAVVAEVNGFHTRAEFNKQVLIDFLSGSTRTEIESKYKNISISTVSRILDSEFRERLKVNDLG